MNHRLLAKVRRSGGGEAGAEARRRLSSRRFAESAVCIAFHVVSHLPRFLSTQTPRAIALSRVGASSRPTGMFKRAFHFRNIEVAADTDIALGPIGGSRFARPLQHGGRATPQLFSTGLFTRQATPRVHVLKRAQVSLHHGFPFFRLLHRELRRQNRTLSSPPPRRASPREPQSGERHLWDRTSWPTREYARRQDRREGPVSPIAPPRTETGSYARLQLSRAFSERLALNFEAPSAARSGRVSSATRRAISEAIFRSNAFTVSWTRRYPSAIETV